MKRRLLSLLTALSLCLALLPVGALSEETVSDWVPKSVSYNPDKPEVALLNIQTGTDEKFYKDILTAYSTKDEQIKRYADYNAVTLYKKADGKQAKYSERGGDTTWTWNEEANPFATSTLFKLMKPGCWGNLEGNLSASFYNRNHKHGTSFEAVYLVVGGRHLRQVIGDSKSSTKFPRIGNLGDLDNYTSLDQFESEGTTGGKITFRHDNLSCTCGKTYAENLLITFRDVQAPTLRSVYYSVSNSNTTPGEFTNYTTDRTYLGTGDYLHIKLSFKEPIRFADDDATDKQNYYISLQGEGTLDESKKAYLYKLEGNDLYFIYKNETKDTQIDVSALNLSNLFQTTKLVQTVKGKDSFAIKMDKNEEKNGYNISSCLITDLAGNAVSMDTTTISKQTAYLVTGANLTVDSKAPCVEKVSYDLNLNNAEVKEAQGKSDPTDKDYPDTSDTHLGVGDTVTLRITMNEVLDLEVKSNMRLDPVNTKYENATVTTNLMEGSSPVTAKTYYFYTETDANSKQHTVFVTYPITMTEDMMLDSTTEINGIGVTDLNFKDTVTDLAGNSYASSQVEANAHKNPPQLDVTPPTVTAESGAYAYDGDDNSFRYTVNISDDSSGTEGIYGSFVLKNGGDDNSYRFQWTVNKSGGTGEETVWNTGITGVPQRFIQIPTTTICIKPDEEESYLDLSNCSLQITGKDFAGNESEVLDTGKTDVPSVGWFVDQTSPVVTVKDSTRKLLEDGSAGELTVSFTMTDSHGVSGWKYAWTDSDSDVPEDSDWHDPQDTFAETSNAAPVDGAVKETVSSGEVFSKYLWILAADNVKNFNGDFKNNTFTICLGKYSYDLREAKYALTYSTAVAERASLQVASLDSADTLIVMVETPTAGNYAVLALTAEKNSDWIGTDTNLLALTSVDYEKDWFHMKVTKDEKGYYTFAPVSGDTPLRMINDTSVNSWWGDITGGKHAGALHVTVLSGKKEAVTRYDLSGNAQSGNESNTIYPPQTAGNSSFAVAEDTFTLRPLGSSTTEPYKISADTVLEPLDTVTNIAGADWDTAKAPVLSTLEGVSFRFTLEADKYGYNFENIDFSGSYLRLKNVTKNTEYQVPLKTVAPSGGKLTQIITVPAGNYLGGGYEVSVYLKCKVGNAQEYWYADKGGDVKGRIQVDDTPAEENLGITSIIARADTAEYYGTLDDVTCVQANGIYYLPVSGVLNAENKQSYHFTVETGGTAKETTYIGTSFAGELDTMVYNGQFSTHIQNTTTGFIHTLEVNHKGAAKFSTASGATQGFYDIKVVDKLPDKDSRDPKVLYLKSNEDNLLIIQQVYANGEKSDVVYQTIHPVEKSYSGIAWVTAENGGQVVFTPDKDVDSLEGLRVYAFAQTGYGSTSAEKLEMALQADGTWRCAFLDSTKNTLNSRLVYRICAVDCYGNRYLLGEKEQAAVMHRFPFERGEEVKDFGENGKKLDGSAVEESAPDGDGTYELIFRMIYDGYDGKDGFPNETNYFKQSVAPQALTLRFSQPSDGQSLWTEEVELTELTGKLDWAEWVNNGKTWTIDGESLSGIYEIKVERTANQIGEWAYGRFAELTVTVKGRVPDGYSGSFDATLTVTDPLGFSGNSKTLTVSNISAVTPVAYDDTAKKAVRPQYTDTGLKLFFNCPVKPVNSWAWQGVEAEGEPEYRTEWTGAFPISGNGTATIQFQDTFGKIYTQELTTSAFTVDGEDKSMTLQFSTEQYTKEAVKVTAAYTNGKELVAREAEVGGAILGSAEGKPLVLTCEENIHFILQGSGNANVGGKPLGLNVYITNIAKEAPEGVLSYYVTSLGAEFSLSELEAYIELCGTGSKGNKTLEVPGEVLVWYTTSRHVTPINDNEFTFTKDNQTDSYTFTYEDDMGNKGSVKAMLPNGLSLVEAATPEDTTPPTVDVELYAKRSTGYDREINFTPDDVSGAVSETTSLKAGLQEIGYVQGYRLTVNAFDPSGFTIELSEDSDKNAVILEGNVLTITKAADFTVIVKDKSANENQVSFQITKDMLEPYFDTTKPTATVTVAAGGLYEKTLYIKLADKNDNGDDTETATLTAPAGLEKVPENADKSPDKEHKGEYKLPVQDNGTVNFVFRDQAGNQGTESYTVTGIDVTPPELAVTWTPPGETYNTETEEFELDYSIPT